MWIKSSQSDLDGVAERPGQESVVVALEEAEEDAHVFPARLPVPVQRARGDQLVAVAGGDEGRREDDILCPGAGLNR